MALLHTCLTDVLIAPQSETDGLEQFLEELLKENTSHPARKSAESSINTMDESGGEITEQNLNALLTSSDSDENWSACESDQENVAMNSDWDVTDDILVSSRLTVQRIKSQLPGYISSRSMFLDVLILWPYYRRLEG